MSNAQNLVRLKRKLSTFLGSKKGKVAEDFINDLLDFNINEVYEDADYEGVDYTQGEVIEHASLRTLSDLDRLGREVEKLF